MNSKYKLLLAYVVRAICAGVVWAIGLFAAVTLFWALYLDPARSASTRGLGAMIAILFGATAVIAGAAWSHTTIESARRDDGASDRS